MLSSLKETHQRMWLKRAWCCTVAVATEMVALTVAVYFLGVSQGSEEKAEHDGLERQHLLLLLLLVLLSKT